MSKTITKSTKKITSLRNLILFGFLTLITQISYSQCQYTVRMMDSWGDGWNGNTLTININGVATHVNVTLAFGSSENYNFDVTNGDQITITWNGGGNYGDETSYQLFDANNTAVSSVMYETSINTPVTANCPTCTRPSTGSATNITFESAELTWQSTSDTVDIKWGTNGFNVQTGGTLISSVSGSTYTLNGLNAITNYSFYVKSICDDSESVWSGPYNFTTLCSIFTTPMALQNFTGFTGSAPSTLPCWSETTGVISDPSQTTGLTANLSGTTSSWGSGNYNNQSGHPYGNAVHINLYGTDDEWLISPQIDLGDGSVTKQLEFSTVTKEWNGNSFNTMNEKYVMVLITTDMGQTWDVITKYDNGNIPFTSRDEIFTLENYSGIVQFAFYAHSETYDPDLRFYIDNFRVIDVPECVYPTNLTHTQTSTTGATLEWLSNGSDFEIIYGLAGFNMEDPSEYTAVVSQTNSVDVDDLQTNVNYSFYVRNNCTSSGNGFSFWSGPYTFQVGYCITGLYTQGCAYGARINGFSTDGAITNISNPSSCSTNAYADYTSDHILVAAAGTQVDFSVLVGNYAAGVALWADWNGDGVFDDSELLNRSAQTHPYGPTPYTGSFIVPTSVAEGDYRLRLRIVEDSTTFTACQSMSYGETEDYTITVAPMPDCLSPTGLGFTQLSLDSALLNWTASDVNNYYEILIGEQGFDPETEGELFILDTNSHIVTGLTSYTEYSFYVRRNCSDSNDGFSTWSGPYNFSVGYCFENLYQYGCSSGAKISHAIFEGGTTGIDNNTGTTSCGANGYNDFTTEHIATISQGAQLDMSIKVGSYSGGVKVWVDWNNDGTFTQDELIGESANTIAQGGIFTAYHLVDANQAIGTYRIRVRVVEGSTNFTACSYQNYGEIEDYTLEVTPAPDCMYPIALTVAQQSLSSAELSWQHDGNNFEVLYGLTSEDLETNGTQITTANTSILLENLTTDAVYAFKVKAICDADNAMESDWSSIKTFSVGYCVPTYSNGGGGDTIDTVLLNDLQDTGLPVDAPYYYNRTNVQNVIPTLQQGTTGVIFIKVGSDTTNYTRVWVDFNGNGVFEPSESFSTNTPVASSGTAAIDIVIPADATLGLTRLRIRAGDDSAISDTQACGASNSNYGRAADYNVMIVSGLDTASFTQATVKLFPNPVKDILTVTADTDIQTISIYNLVGQKVMDTTVNSASNQLDVSKLSAGTYLVKVKTAQGIQDYKIVKN